MSSPRHPQVDQSSHQSSGSTARSSEIAIQADRDAESDDESQSVIREYDFLDPFLFSDATLVVQNRTLHCHRAILSLHSPVFKAMFGNRYIENQKNEVILSKDSFEDVRETLTHMYTPGGCEMTAEAAQRLMPIIHRYQMDHLVSLAERAMAFRLTDSSAPAFLQLADVYGLTKLRQAALDTCARLDVERLHRLFKDVELNSDLRSEILEKRVGFLEKCLLDIQNSFTHSCSRVESRMERIASNHCSDHPGPLTHVQVLPPPPPPTELVNGDAPEAPTSVPPASTLPPSTPGPVAQRMDITASILPAAAALRSTDMRPVDENARVNGSLGNLNTIWTSTNRTQAIPAGPTFVCKKCTDHLKNHIIEVCKRGLHKIPIVMMRNT